MLRRSQRTVLALFAVTAIMGGAGTAVAGAASFSADSYPMSVSAEPRSELILTLGGTALKCTPPAMTGQLAAPSTSLQMEGSTLNCTATANLNGCGVRFEPGQSSGGGNYAGTFSIKGSKCVKGITIKTLGGTCEFTIPPQGGLPVTFGTGTEGGKAIDALVSTWSLKYNATAGCPGGAVTNANGGWQGTWRLKAATGVLSITP